VSPRETRKLSMLVTCFPHCPLNPQAYIIAVTYEGQEWQVARRFRMFEKLHAMVRPPLFPHSTAMVTLNFANLVQLKASGVGKQKLPDLPKTHILWRGLDRDYVKSKVQQIPSPTPFPHPHHHDTPQTIASLLDSMPRLNPGREARCLLKRPPQDRRSHQLTGYV